ncbi:MAG: PAS domain S-box protein [Deltaproteobacteria bacterium]|nr:PAS domain S-box protein [Deltaproteobacteria bacterium]
MAGHTHGEACSLPPPPKWAKAFGGPPSNEVVFCLSDTLERPGAQPGLIRWKIVPWPGPDHLPRGTVHFAENLGLQPDAAEITHHSESRLAQIIDFLPDATFVIDHRGRVVAWNRAIEKMTGIKALDILGKGDYEYSLPFYGRRRPVLIDLVNRKDPKVESSYASFKREGEILFSETQLKNTSGLGARHLWNVAGPLYDLRGNQIGAIESIRDVSGYKNALKELEDSQTRYRDLFNSINDIIYTQDMEGRFLSANAALCNLLGCSETSILGRKASEFMQSRMRPLFVKEYLGDLKTKGFHHGTSAYQTRQGKRSYIEYKSTLVTPEDGPPYISGSGRDVTERVLANRKLKKLQEQLIQSQKMEAMGTLAGGIAHDFNNILAAIMGYAELAGLAPTLGRDPAPDLARILSAAERARDLVRRILTFSRKVAAERRPLDLNQAVTRALGLLEHTLPRMVRLEARLFPGLAMVSADPNQMEQIILNLATNAADAMPGGGRLLLETRNVHLPEEGQAALPEIRPGEYALLEVADSGQGMDPATLEHIYDPFFTTKEVGKGTGLGLSTVYGIVKAHEGHILCESGPARGTVFRVFLPALGADAAAEASLAPAARPDQPGQETVWLVDDEEALREMGARLLESVGYQVRAAASGEELLAMYREAGQRPDLVILDLNMPGMGGEKCLRELLALDPRARILVASGYSSAGQAPDCLAAGAAAYLAKPFRLPDLLAAVREVLDRPPPEAPPA